MTYNVFSGTLNPTDLDSLRHPFLIWCQSCELRAGVAPFMLAVQCQYPVQKGMFWDDWSRTDALPVAQPIVIVLVHWRGSKHLIFYWSTDWHPREDEPNLRRRQCPQWVLNTSISMQLQRVESTVSAMQKYGPLSFRMHCGCLFLWILHDWSIE